MADADSQAFDDLIDQFSCSVDVSSLGIFRTENVHPAYKGRKKHLISQHQRRIDHLNEQKKNRSEILNQLRNLVDSIEDDSQMEWSSVEKRPTHPSRKYKNQLMMSEWLVDKPENFATDWLMVLCPIGKRSLVVASGGKTKAFARNGSLLNIFPSLLPGGNRHHQQSHKQSCIIDCIFNEKAKTFYILDIICWNNINLFECETEMRFHWLNSKINEEYNQIFSRSNLNPYRFVPLKQSRCDPDVIKSILDEDLPFELDGILFYHKKCQYVPERTPLVAWLKLNMVLDVLDISLRKQINKDCEIED